MTELGKDARHKLAAICQADRPMITNRQLSKDGTIKWLIRCDDGQEAEMVYIPEEDRGTFVHIKPNWVHINLLFFVIQALRG